MAPDNADKRSTGTGKLSGWPRPRPSIAKSMGLNPVRMALLIVMALVGLFGGYYLGKEVAPAPETGGRTATENSPKPAATQETGAEQDDHAYAPNGVYEESLPRDIIIESGGILKRIALPEPEAEIDLGNGNHRASEQDAGSASDPSTETAQSGAGAAPETEAPGAGQSGDSDTPAAEEEAEPAPPAPRAPTETASLPEPRLAPALPANIAELQKTAGAKLPAWQRYALPVVLGDKPKIVIVIDDLGLDRRRTRRMIGLPGPLTLSFMAYAENLKPQAARAHDAGHELMLHVPMEPSSESIDPGPNVLLSGMPKSELVKNVEWNLSQLDGYVGINNHMGSRFTSDAESMKVVAAALKEHGYLFLDSVTSGRSVAHETARDAGIPFAVRNVFLDHEDDTAAIRDQLRHTEQIARKTGLAIAIGHPRDKTIGALEDWLPTLAEKGFQLVPISAVVRIAGK